MSSINLFTRVVATGAALFGVVFVLFAIWSLVAGTANPYGAGVLGLMGGYLVFRGLWAMRRNLGTTYDFSNPPNITFNQSPDARFEVLDRLKLRGMITAEEYDAKRQEILKKI